MSKKLVILLFAGLLAFAGCSKVLKSEDKGPYDKAVVAIEVAKKEIKDTENMPIAGEKVELFKTAKEKLATAESFMGISNFEKAIWFADQARDTAIKAREVSKK